MIVLVAVAVMSLSAGVYVTGMQNELRASRNSGKGLQARLLADSAAAYATGLLSLSDEDLLDLGGVYDNPEQFQRVLVVDDVDPEMQGRFSLVARHPETGLLRFGLQNESAKLNVNALLAGDDEQQTAARERLSAIPGINDELADAILDWIDPDNEARNLGAEESYYTGLQPPYEPRNGPIASLDELLAVRGVTPELLYGIDANRNLRVDVGESSRGVLMDYDTSTGLYNRGIADYLTVHSLNTPPQPAGSTLTDLNGDNLQQIYNKLITVVDEAEAKFIIAYRQGSTMPAENRSQAQEARTFNIDFNKKPARNIDSLLDLVGVKVQITPDAPGGNRSGDAGSGGGGGGGRGGGGGQSGAPTIVQSPWEDEAAVYRDSLPKLFEAFSLGEPAARAGLVDVNQASRSVLLSVDGIDSQTADQIISRRDPVTEPTDYRRYPVWLVADGLVDLETMKQIEPFLTVGGDVYSAQAVGYFGSGRPVCRLQLVIDRNKGAAAVVSRSDLTPLGPGFSLIDLGEEAE